MTIQTSPILTYGTGGKGIICPLCRKRSCAKKIYGHDVCKKCFYAFANRRQIGYFIDAIVFALISFGVGYAIGLAIESIAIAPLMFSLLIYVLNVIFVLIFICKDGFNGHSIGKYAMGVQVLDATTDKPGGFFHSFKRNSPLLFVLIPFVGQLVNLIIVLMIALQCAKGFRLADKFANTRVIWKKFAHLPVFGGNALACESCGYDLTGNTSGVCPECGVALSVRNRQLAALDPAPTVFY